MELRWSFHGVLVKGMEFPEGGHMPVGTVLSFSPFHLDPANEQLWKGTQLVPLRPKPSAILRYLVARPGQLVTKEELLKGNLARYPCT